MPTYSYYCKKCESEQEVFHGMNEDPKVKCPVCKAKCKRLIGSGGYLKFIGDGWAKDGYTNSPTPLQGKEENAGTCFRIPEYADKKTGRKLGYGAPEIANPNESKGN